MTYTVPTKPADPKPRLVRVTDAGEIEAIQRCGFADPIGVSITECGHQSWFAEADSLRQYRERLALADGVKP
jgi:hypothetical protein